MARIDGAGFFSGEVGGVLVWSIVKVAGEDRLD